MFNVIVNFRFNRGLKKAYPQVERKFLSEVCKTAVITGYQSDSYTGNESYAKNLEICVLFCDDGKIRLLNQQYRGKDYSTNVLSFPNRDDSLEPNMDDDPEHLNYLYLGDIAISLPTVEREATAEGKTMQNHLAHMLVHGTLHLMGYDHENNNEAEIMENLEINILSRFAIPDPYALRGAATSVQPTNRII